jgi:small subunit ribosomal protein S20
MANTKSAEKAARKTQRRYVINRARTSRVRTYMKKVEEAIASGDKTVAAAAFKEAQPILQSGVNKGTLRKNTVSRKLSRLSKRIKALA